MDMAAATEERAPNDEQASGRDPSMQWCNRSTEIGELLALVARSLRPVSLAESKHPFDELLEPIGGSRPHDRQKGRD